LSEYIAAIHKIPSIESYTTRHPRYEGEKGHTFVSDLEYEATPKKDLLAYTKFGDYHYWTVHSDLEESNVYVIDEIGLKEMKEKFKDKYNIFSIWIDRNENLRNVSQERKNRDDGMFKQENKSLYDAFIFNNGNIEETLLQLDMVLQGTGLIKKTPSPMDYIYYVEKLK
jgi:guanylate kinase